MHAWLTEQFKRVSGRSSLTEAISYALRRWQGLVLFLDDSQREMDTNTFEAATRPITPGRKDDRPAFILAAQDHKSSQMQYENRNGAEPGMTPSGR
jgi:hypothetical protein